MITSEMHQHQSLLEDVQATRQLPFDEPRSISLEDAIVLPSPLRPQLSQSTTNGIRRFGSHIHAILLLFSRIGAPAQKVARRSLSHRHSYSVTEFAKGLLLPGLVGLPLPHELVALDSCEHASP